MMYHPRYIGLLLSLYTIIPTATCFLIPSINNANVRFIAPTPQNEQQKHNVIRNTKLHAAALPKDVKEAVSVCRQSVQKALEGKISRMDIEMPVGAKFGVEKGGKKKSSAQDDGVSRDTLETSDRELARLFVDMFQPVGGDNIAVAFRDDRIANLARKRWKGDNTAQCRILSVDGKKSGASADGKKKKKKGFAAKLAEELDTDSGGPFALPKGCEVALFVDPGPKELIAIERISNDAGMGTLIILLNARLGKVEKFSSEAAEQLFLNDFIPVFHLAAAATQDTAPNCLMHRAYPGDWVLARKPKVGQPKVLATQPGRFTSEECQTEYENMPESGDLEKGVENVLENVATWFR